MSCSWIGRIHTVKTSTLIKVIHRLNALLIKIPMVFFIETAKKFLKIHLKPQKTPTAKASLRKNKVGSTTLSNFK